MVATISGGSTSMDGRRFGRRCVWAACAITIVISVIGCIGQQDSMLALSDRIESEADSMRWSQKADAALSHHFESKAPWVVIFIPRKGFDEEGAAKAGIQEELRRNVARRSQEWHTAALMVYATPHETSITKLPDKVDVREQVVLRGQPGDAEIVVSLVRGGEEVLISSITSR
jgi:hypothetical protein